MADEIVNRLGFDASEALSALTQLEDRLRRADQAMSNFGKSLASWNDSARPAKKTLQTLAQQARATVEALERVNKVQPMQTPQAATPMEQHVSPVWSAYQSILQRVQNLFQGVQSASQAAGNQIVQTGRDAADATREAKGNTQKWVVSWETMARVVATQFMVRALSQIRNALRQAISDSMEFQQSIAELRTIVPSVDRDFQSLSREVANLSRQFNIPLPDAAKAVYQAVSNQFAETAERAKIMESAAQLARVGVMDLEQAVLLITGRLNAFGMSASQADQIAAQLFTTIEKGRVQGRELANVMGRIDPIATEAGVRVHEVNAALAALTVGGMKASEAGTSLRAAIASLIKPSEELQVVFRELGYESGDQMIRALGLQGALEALMTASEGNVATVVRLIPNIRALNAQLRLAGSGAENAADAMAALEQSSREALQQTYELFVSTDAERLSKELQNLRTTLTEDVGASLISTLRRTMDLAGGGEHLATVIAGVGTAAAGTALSLGGLGAVMAAKSIQLKLAAMQVGGLGVAIAKLALPISAAVGLVTYFESRMVQSLESARREFRQTQMERIAAIESRMEEEIRAEQKHNDEIISLFERRAAALRRSHFRLMDDVVGGNDQLVQSSRTTLSALVGAREQAVRTLRQVVDQSQSLIQSSIQRTRRLEAGWADDAFRNAQRNLSAYQAAEAFRRRAVQLTWEAQEAMEGARTQDEVQQALATFQRAQAHAEEAGQIAATTDNIHLQRQAAQAVLGVTRSQIDAERTLQSLQRRRAEEAAEAAREEQARVRRMQALSETILEQMTLFDRGDPRERHEREQQITRVRDSMEELRRLWLTGEEFDLGDLVAFDALQQRLDSIMEEAIDEAEIEELFASPQALEDLNRQITEGLGPIEVLMTAPEALAPHVREELEGAGVEETLRTLSREMQNASSQAAKYERRLNEAALANEIMRSSAGEMTADLQYWENRLETFGAGSGTWWRQAWSRLSPFSDMPQDVRGELEHLLRFVQGIADAPQGFDREQYDYLRKWVRDVSEIAGITPIDRAQLQGVLEAAKTIADQTERVQVLRLTEEEDNQRLQESRDLFQTLEEMMDEANRRYGGILEPLAESEEGFRNVQEYLESIGKADLSGPASQLGAMADAAERIASAGGAGRASPADSWQYRSLGGPVGTDTRPTMLSADEVVMTAAASQRFASQLVAMNAGVQPIHRSEGGSVTNIGDINVTVQGGETGRQTARSIANELRRELRRGTHAF